MGRALSGLQVIVVVSKIDDRRSPAVDQCCLTFTFSPSEAFPRFQYLSLPIFNKRNEPLPTIKAAVRLLRVIFSTAISIPEFHRQVSLPHIIKFTGALIPLADSYPDIELKVDKTAI